MVTVSRLRHINAILIIAIFICSQLLMAVPAQAELTPGESPRASSSGTEAWDYNPDVYNPVLAETTAFYLTLSPDLPGLEKELASDGFTRLESFNYSDTGENQVAFIIASKNVNYHGQPRTVTAVICRATGSLDEWQGNMDITGGYYDPDQLVHASFNRAAEDIEKALVDYLHRQAIVDPVLLIAGHSRGAAAANILADRLSNRVYSPFQDSPVFAYTFATPNVSRAEMVSRPNIFNFCFEDDIVTRLPLEKWGYDKAGRDCTAVAESLYNTPGSSFKSALGPADFNRQAARDLLALLEGSWPELNDYYNKKWFSQYDWRLRTATRYRDETLYSFLRNKVAGSLYGEPAAVEAMLNTGSGSPAYLPLMRLIIDGSQVHHNIEDTHKMQSYYLAVQQGCFLVLPLDT